MHGEQQAAMHSHYAGPDNLFGLTYIYLYPSKL